MTNPARSLPLPEPQSDPEDQLSLEALIYRRLTDYIAALQDHEPRDLYGLLLPQLERPLIRVAMELAEGRQVRAASMLGIHRNTLRTKLRELGLDREDFALRKS